MAADKHVPDFFDAPIRLKVADGRIIVFKADVFFLGLGLCAAGGWASEPLNVSLEADGQEIQPVMVANHFRSDVNIALDKADDEPRAFGLVAELAGDSQNLALVCRGLDDSFRFTLALDPQKALTDLEPSFPGVLGEEVFAVIRQISEKNNSATFSKHGQLDYAVRLDCPGYDNVTVVFGWLAAPANAKLCAAKKGRQASAPVLAYFWPRGDIEKGKGPSANSEQAGYGFMASIRDLPKTDATVEIWGEEAGRRMQLASAEIQTCITFRQFLDCIFAFPVPWSEAAPCYAKILLPVLSKLQTQHLSLLAKRPNIEGSVGQPAASPAVSVIIPLYGNLKFLQSQLMLFSEDKAFREFAELVYVMDDPYLLDNFKMRAEELGKLYNIAFKWIANGSNQGFSGANNLGASIAKGDLLVFMNSDVFPNQPGWLEAFREHFANYQDTGVAGCQLLHPSGVVQHCGMDFVYSEYQKVWTNHHPCDGCDPTLLEETTCEKAAVTGACIAMPKELFAQLGGFCRDYLIGDFEDSDLCFRVRQLGKKVMYLPHISLTHFVRQTFRMLGTGAVSQRLIIYNALLHQSKWGRELQMMAGSE